MHGRRVAAWVAAGGLTFVFAGGCAQREHGSGPELTKKPPLFDLGPHRRATSTKSPKAQEYFDQGLNWTFSFNHDEAIRAFHQAAELDPQFAFAWWGVALNHGPHVNNPTMTPERSRMAWEALQRARSLSQHAAPVERALIDALAARYAWPVPEDRVPLDRAYADAMQKVYEQHPEDLDVVALYAESLMDLQPWDYWTHAGEPKGRSPEIVALLEKVLAANPNHPGATHYYIHAVEASQSPERALRAANALRHLVPASGHMTHMPSHIDVRTGGWERAAQANRDAIAADAAYRKRSPRQGFYRLYMQHNQQFLSFACMMLGREKEALSAGKAAVESAPPEWVKENAIAIDGYMTVHMDALKRFGKWDALLALPEPPEYLPYTRAMWRFNRGVALAAQGKIEAAEREREKFAAAMAAVPEGRVAQINPAERVLTIAQHMLDGEIAYARRDYAAAERELRAAVAIEDKLQYMEPPDWMQPVRHTLGAVLIDAGEYAAAEQVYREDLQRWPNNGWSLLGLARAQEQLGQNAQATDTRSRLERAWASADAKPHASCLCAPKTQ